MSGRLNGSFAHHLVSQEENSLETELSVAKVEKVLERGAEEVNDHGIVVAFLTIPADKGYSDTTCQRLVHLCLILELRVLCLDRLELDGYLFTADDVDAEVNVTERPGANLFADAVLKVGEGCAVSISRSKGRPGSGINSP